MVVKATELANAGNYPANRLDMRERKVLEVAEQLSSPNANLGAIVTQDAAINALAATVGPVGGAIGERKTVRARYSFATHTGAQGTISLGVELPDNAVVIGVVEDIITAPTSASSTGTMQLVLPTDGALNSALTADGTVPNTQVNLSAPVKTTAARNLSVTIATNNVLSGIVDYYVTYIQGG